MNFKIAFKSPEPVEPPAVTLPLPVSTPGRRFVDCPLDLLRYTGARVDGHAVKRVAYETTRKGGDLYVMATPDGVLVDGALRFHAARLMGWKTIQVAVIALPDLSFDQRQVWRRSQKR